MVRRSQGLGLVLCAAVLLPATAAWAWHDDDAPPKAVPPAEIYKPTPMPDRIILTWTGDPAHSQAVTWRTDASVKKGLAQIAPAGPGPDFVKGARDVEASSQPLESDTGVAHYHTAKFEGLTPATKYAYRVGDGANWSEWFQFRTPAEGPAPLTFVYFGDAQNDLKTHWSRVIREAHADAPRAHFFLHAGDLINNGSADTEWGEWHGAGGWLNAMIPSIPTPGNHEYRSVLKTLTPHWRPQFALPEDGPAGLEETAYVLDIQGIRIVSLNSNDKLAEQAEWLDKVLTGNLNPWTILTFHHPVFSSAKGRDNKAVRELWQPVIDKHKVDLVLTGHDHTYARTGLERAAEVNVPSGITARDERSGTVYVVSVSGPKMYALDREPRMHRAAQDTQLYQIIRVDGGVLTYEARTATGDLYDGFELRKHPGEPNELIERRPDTPERLGKPAPVDAAESAKNP